MHLSVVVHGEGDMSGVAPVDEPDARAVPADVQLVDDGDDRLLDHVEARPSDATRTVQNEHQVHQSAAVCTGTRQASAVVDGPARRNRAVDTA